MKSANLLLRLLQINRILAQNGLDNLIVELHLFTPFRWVVYLNPWNWFRKNTMTRGEALRKSCEQLGPIFIKFGQALSTRPDILPQDITDELAKLQDHVPPFPSAQALHIIETSFGQSAYDLFEYFEPIALASASMAQVHAAKLKNGDEVVVKILRPNLEKLIQQDIRLLYAIAHLAQRYWSRAARFKPERIVREFEETLMSELDLQREAANACQLKRNFQDSPLLYVPTIYWDYVRKNICVMERIYGIPVTDIAQLNAHGVDIKQLAERGVTLFFTQVFRDCFFHADMHPGNIFVSYQHPEAPQLICVDFGIMGSLSETDKRYIAENLIAFFNRDYRRVATLHIESGWIPRNTRVEAFESAIRTVCEPIFEKPLKDISFGMVVMRLLQVARQFEMRIQPQLILLQKTLLAVEGLGRQLYPDLDPWVTAKPFLNQWLKKQLGPRSLLTHLRDNIPFLIEKLPYMPRLLNDLLELKREEALELREAGHDIQVPPPSKNLFFRGLTFGLLFSGLLVTSLIHWHILRS